MHDGFVPWHSDPRSPVGIEKAVINETRLGLDRIAASMVKRSLYKHDYTAMCEWNMICESLEGITQVDH